MVRINRSTLPALLATATAYHDGGPDDLIRECPECGSGDVVWCSISVRPYCNECKHWGPVHYGPAADAVKAWNRAVELANMPPCQHCGAEARYHRPTRKNRRRDIKAILQDPAMHRDLMIRGIIAVQASEGITTTEEQAAQAYDDVMAGQ